MQQEEYRDPGSFHFHYDREERMNTVSSQVRDRMERNKGSGKDGSRKPLFKRNRSLMILLLDVVIILFLYFIILPLLGLGENPSTEQIDGYSMQLNGFVFEEKTLLSLKIERVDETIEGKSTTVTVVFSVKGTERMIKAIDVLPEENGSSRIIRATIPFNGEEKQAYAEITFNDKKALVETKLSPEIE